MDTGERTAARAADERVEEIVRRTAELRGSHRHRTLYTPEELNSSVWKYVELPMITPLSLRLHRHHQRSE